MHVDYNDALLVVGAVLICAGIWLLTYQPGYSVIFAGVCLVIAGIVRDIADGRSK
jgi:hypothetical protein